METVVLVIAVLAAGLVMTSGVWVAVVLIAAVARVKPPAAPAAESRTPKKAGP
jgi:hypothetical protein